MEVSVIIPVYNAETWLSRCIDSILCQTFSDFELILVDDGSNDSSLDIMKHYAQSDKRIVCVFAKKNGGASKARNLGLDKATGKYIMFADSDDCVASDWIELLLYEQKKNVPLFVMSNIYDSFGNSDRARLTDYHKQKVEEKDFYTLFSLHLDGYLFNKVFDCQEVVEGGAAV